MDPADAHGSAAEAGPSVPTRLTPSRSGRPWGGGRFGSVDGLPVGELWVSGADATLPDGRTLAEAGLASSLPLVKILDIAGTLSVQVHPDDETARTMFGPEAVGKHECWVVLEAARGAVVAVGLSPGASIEDLFSADAARVAAALRQCPVAPGTVLDIPPGMVHAPAAGLVLYEIQQRSDLTFRIWDWGRPRELHLEASRRAIRPAGVPHVATLPAQPGLATISDALAPFRLDICRLTEAAGGIDVALDRPAVISVVDGPLQLAGVAAPSTAHMAIDVPIDPGSHWLVPAGRWSLRGAGLALIATA